MSQSILASFLASGVYLCSMTLKPYSVCEEHTVGFSTFTAHYYRIISRRKLSFIISVYLQKFKNLNCFVVSVLLADNSIIIIIITITRKHGTCFLNRCPQSVCLDLFGAQRPFHMFN